MNDNLRGRPGFRAAPILVAFRRKLLRGSVPQAVCPAYISVMHYSPPGRNNDRLGHAVAEAIRQLARPAQGGKRDRRGLCRQAVQQQTCASPRGKNQGEKIPFSVPRLPRGRISCACRSDCSRSQRLAPGAAPLLSFAVNVIRAFDPRPAFCSINESRTRF